MGRARSFVASYRRDELELAISLTATGQRIQNHPFAPRLLVLLASHREA